MTRIVWYVILISVAVIFVMSNHHASAISYEPSDFKLSNNPVICAFEPSDDPNILNLSDKMLSLTEYAFDDWKTKITNGERHSAWDMTLIKVMRSQQNTFDVSQCNIRINYFPNPNGRINDLEPTGMTQYYTDNTARIEIYYSNYGDGYYTNGLGTDEQLSKTLEHELGHAFGLSHVILSDQELQNIDSGAEDMPSIMIPYSLSVGIHHYSITPADIYQLKSIYNYQGFGGYAQTTYPSIQPSTTPQQISINTDKQVYYYGDHVTITINVSKVTGANATLTLTTRDSQTEGAPIPLSISQLQTSITSPFALNETNSPTGTVDVTLSYGDQTTDTSFQIIGQQPSITSQSGTESPTLPNPEEPVVNDPKYDVFRNPLLSDIQNGYISDVNFGNSFFALGEDGLIHVNMYEKSNGSVIKPSWFNSVISLWAERKISDRDYASCIQFLYDSKLLQM